MYCFFLKENFDHYLTFLMYTHVPMKIMREAARAKIFQKIKKLFKYLKVKNIQNTFIY